VRERGLKYFSCLRRSLSIGVAPRAGAWIEMWSSPSLRMAFVVAPRAGAWIEIIKAVI